MSSGVAAPGMSAPILARLSRVPRRVSTLATGGLMLVALLAAALGGPYLSPYQPTAHDFEQLLQPPSLLHPFGTDNFGRDVLTRVLHGALIDLRIGLLAVAFPFLFGSLLGATAGYFGGWVDTLLMRAVDVITAVPFLVLVIPVVAFLRPGGANILIAIARGGWGGPASPACTPDSRSSSSATGWPTSSGSGGSDGSAPRRRRPRRGDPDPARYRPRCPGGEPHRPRRRDLRPRRRVGLGQNHDLPRHPP